MRYREYVLASALLLLGGCTLLQATPAGEQARQKIVEGMAIYCTQPQVVRLQNREWINANSPHRIEVTCALDEPPT